MRRRMGSLTVTPASSSYAVRSHRAMAVSSCVARCARRTEKSHTARASADTASLRLLRCALIAGLILAGGLTAAARAASPSPYAVLPRAGDSVRFDGSVGGERNAWAYPNQASLEAFLRSTIDASLQGASYEQYAKSAAGILNTSLEIDGGTQGVVQRILAFAYRGHSDTEVQVRITSGPLARALVWTTPTELVDGGGHRYLR